jgi:segregation and condensation protein A
MSYKIKIDNFEGPLDLLLHLIKKNEVDIYDIPIADITAQYLAAIDVMKSLNLDVAGEFLLMAATLIHIKSRMLLPQAEEEKGDNEEEDPRDELVRRLLEYQKYKDAADALCSLPLLERDVFPRKCSSFDWEETKEREFQEVGLYELVEAFRGVLREDNEKSFHKVDMERLSVLDRVNSILLLFSRKESVAFGELFTEPPSRQEVVVTFLAMLELIKLRLVRIMQNSPFGPVWLYPAVAGKNVPSLELEDESFGYG